MSLDANQMTEGPAVADTNTNINHWPRLSEEMVLFILGHLPQKDLVNVSMINRKFRDLSRDGSLWTEVTLDYEDIKRKAETCRKLVERCKKLASLKISNKSLNNWKPLNIMTVVIRAKETLKSLAVDFSMETWTPAAMAKLGRLKNLTSLTMSFHTETNVMNGYAGAKMLEELANLDRLEVLNLVIKHNYSFHTNTNSLPVMKTVFQKLKKLKNVKISPSHYDESLVVTLAKNNPDLTGLHLMNYPSLSDECVDLLANSCPGFQEFNISFTHSDIEMTKLSSSIPNLKHLLVGGCYGARGGIVVEEQLIKIVEKFRRLERIDLETRFCHFALTDSGVERIVRAAEDLKHLGLGWAPRVTKDLVERLRIEYPDLDIRNNCY